jgi:hypothetical protein
MDVGWKEEKNRTCAGGREKAVYKGKQRLTFGRWEAPAINCRRNQSGGAAGGDACCDQSARVSITISKRVNYTKNAALGISSFPLAKKWAFRSLRRLGSDRRHLLDVPVITVRHFLD